MFKFKVIQKCFQDASAHDGNDADFYLEQNDWDDHGYHVLYHLHATKRLTKDKSNYSGTHDHLLPAHYKLRVHALCNNDVRI